MLYMGICNINFALHGLVIDSTMVEHTRSVQCFKCGKFGNIRRYCRT